jgi:hypothetical protein
LAILATFSRLLRSAACHAEHVFRPLPIEIVIFDRIMAVPASVPMLTLKALNLDVALVVHTAKSKLAFAEVLLLLLAMVCTTMVDVWSVGGACVAGSQFVRILGIEVGRG